MTFAGCGHEANEVVLAPEPKESSSPAPDIASDRVVPTQVEMPLESIEDAKTLLMQTGEALQAGNIQVAGRAIRQAVSMEPDDPQIVFTMAIVLSREHRFPEAVMMLDKLSQDVPETRLPALGQTAEWLVMQGKWEVAESRFRAVLQNVPDAAMAHRQLAQLLLRQGRRIEAANHLQALCRLGNIEEIELRALLSHADPFAADLARESLDPIGPLGRARLAISNGDWDQAATLLSGARTRTPQEFALLGRVHAQRGDFPSLEAWASDPANAELWIADAWFARAVLADHQSDHDVAAQYFCRAVLLDPTDQETYQRMAKSLNSMGSVAKAEEARKRASWLAQTLEIGKTMAASEHRDANQIAKLAKLLDQLQRPLESLSWQAVGLAYQRSELTAPQQQSRLADINRQRLQRVNESPKPPNEEFICCGMPLQESHTSTVQPVIKSIQAEQK